MERKQRAVRIVGGALLVLAVLFLEKIPSVGEKSVVRGIAAEKAADQYTVYLFYQKAEPQADAADAREKMKLSLGEGTSLLQAFTQAEKRLEGAPVYQLCDLVAVSGRQTAQLMRGMVNLVSSSGRGRLSAHVLHLEALPDSWKDVQEEDVITLYHTLSSHGKSAPRLYETAAGAVLLPNISEQQDTLFADGAMMVPSEGALFELNENEMQFFLAVRSGRGQLRIQTEEMELCVALYVSAEAAENKQLRRTVYYQIEENNADNTAIRSQTEQTILACREVWNTWEAADPNWGGLRQRLQLSYGLQTDITSDAVLWEIKSVE